MINKNADPGDTEKVPLETPKAEKPHIFLIGVLRASDVFPPLKLGRWIGPEVLCDKF